MINKLGKNISIAHHRGQQLVGLVMLLVITSCSCTSSFAVPTSEKVISGFIENGEDVDVSPSDDGWQEYRNLVYPFSFSYPADWNIEEPRDHFILLASSDKKWELTIGVKWSEEGVSIVHTGVSAGDMSPQEEASFFEQQIDRVALMYRGKVKAILYDGAREIKTGNLIFSLSLNNIDIASSYDEVEVPEDIQDTINDIIESFVADRDS